VYAAPIGEITKCQWTSNRAGSRLDPGDQVRSRLRQGGNHYVGRDKIASVVGGGQGEHRHPCRAGGLHAGGGVLHDEALRCRYAEQVSSEQIVAAIVEAGYDEVARVS